MWITDNHFQIAMIHYSPMIKPLKGCTQGVGSSISTIVYITTHSNFSLFLDLVVWLISVTHPGTSATYGSRYTSVGGMS